MSLIIPIANCQDYDTAPELKQQINHWIEDKIKYWVENKVDRELEYVFSQKD